MDEEGPQEPSIDFVPALCFVPRGVAKESPDRIVLSQDELARVIQETTEALESDDDTSDSDNEMEVDNQHANPNAPPAQAGNQNINPEDEYGFANYEDEEDSQAANIGNIVDPEHQVPDEDDDSEAEDEIIKPNDSLLLVGHVQDDAASMEVWVFNQDEESLYTHHDFLLPSFPLCIEWLNHDPGNDQAGNLCAIGCMDPVICIWDLDIQDSIEATFKLGSKGNRRKGKQGFGHKDAVLDLSWNKQYEHILASGSVDQTLLLWDLDEGAPHTKITAFREKVQSVEFHPQEAQTILTGCADGYVRLFDCRDPGKANTSCLKLKVSGEVEKVLWNPCDDNYFSIGTNAGLLLYADKRRMDQVLWTTQAHEEEISGICFNNQVQNLMTTTSTEGILKVWNYTETGISEVYTHDFQMGRLQCMKQCPEDPFTLAFGGEKAPRCRIFNIKNFEAVRRTFNIPDLE